MVADHVLFNSKFNMESFLNGIKGHLKLIPDHRPKDLDSVIRPKCKVLHFPINFAAQMKSLSQCPSGTPANLEVEEQQLAEPSAPKCSRVGPTSDVKHSAMETGDTDYAKRDTVKRKSLHIVWPHRWEHDKNPDVFFKVLLQLKEEGLDFRVSVLGEQFTDVPGKLSHT